MKMNIGAWIGIIGGILGFTIAIISVLMTTGEMGIYIAASMLLVFGGMFYLFYKLFFAPILLTSRLLKTGIPGKALIKEVSDTGVTVNNNPQVKLLLEVKNNFGQVYDATVRTLISRLQPGLYQPGMTVPVLIDPKNEMRMIIDTSGGHTIPLTKGRPDADKVKAELQSLQQKDDAIRITGISTRAIVKKYLWLGVNVNGSNPYVELEIEVLPADAPSFNAKVKGVIAQASVPKYQPGEEIYVKYDATDRSKVAMDHS